ncbi:UTRA domain-containing protein [Salinibius halmophilus]|uniref:UTRA domain-containing protein n=1 Tax=Salinibius halmophilus TaxID=1853216 RepID=UPI000E666D29|nr:UTRA domain-containing protein [Salinibius halmophilus]
MAVSKAIQIKNALSELIQQDSSKLPSERELSQQFNTTRITIREALKLLESEGKIYRSNRRGWYPSPARLKYDPALHAKKSIMVFAREQGFEPRSEVVKIFRIRCDKTLALAMRTSEGKPLVGVNRLRYLDDRPVVLEKMLFREDLIPGIENEDFSGSIHQVLREKYNVKFGENESDITVTCATGEDAEILQTTEGAATLHIQRSYSFNTNEIFEYDEELWRADAIKIHLHAKYDED